MRDDGSGTYMIEQSTPVISYATSKSGPTHKIEFDAANFILIHENSFGLSVQVQATGSRFAGSVGMYGSWDHGFARFRDGTIFDTSGGFAATAATSINLALDWKVDPSNSVLHMPSPMCDGSPTCGTGNVFLCNSVRRDLEIFESNSKNRKLATSCGKTCADITEPMTQLMCMEDMILSGGSEEWACDPAKLVPIVIPASPEDFAPHPIDATQPICFDSCAALQKRFCDCFFEGGRKEGPNENPDQNAGGCTDDEIQSITHHFDMECVGCDYDLNEDECEYHPCQGDNCTHTSGCQPGTFLVSQTCVVCSPIILRDTQQQETKIIEACCYHYLDI